METIEQWTEWEIKITQPITRPSYGLYIMTVSNATYND